MITKLFIAFLCLVGTLSALKENALTCGGDILVDIEDVHFRQIEAQVDETVCVFNNADEAALVKDVGDVGELQFEVAAHSSIFLEAQTSYQSRLIVIDNIQ